MLVADKPTCTAGRWQDELGLVKVPKQCANQLGMLYSGVLQQHQGSPYWTPTAPARGRAISGAWQWSRAGRRRLEYAMPCPFLSRKMGTASRLAF